MKEARFHVSLISFFRTPNRDACYASTLAWKMACNKPSKEVLPVTVDSAWKLVSSEPESAIPDVISKLGCKQARRAIYEGPAKLTVAVFEMTSSAGAFEVLQNWRVERRTVPLQKDKYFVLVTGANDKVLAEFASAFEKAL